MSAYFFTGLSSVGSPPGLEFSLTKTLRVSRSLMVWRNLGDRSPILKVFAISLFALSILDKLDSSVFLLILVKFYN